MGRTKIHSNSSTVSSCVTTRSMSQISELNSQISVVKSKNKTPQTSVIPKKPSKSRRPNFTHDEQNKIVLGVRNRFRIISDSFGSTISHEQKENAWKEIRDEVNAVSPCIRDVGEIKKKYQTLKMQVKEVEANNRKEMRKTGGGEANLKTHGAIGTMLLEMIPECSISGVEGGIDVFDETDVMDCLAASENSSKTKTRVEQLDRREALGKILLEKRGPGKKFIPPSSNPVPRIESSLPSTSKGLPPKVKKPETPGNKLISLQTSQVQLLVEQGVQLKRIADFLETKNDIELRKLELKQDKLKILKEINQSRDLAGFF